MFRCISNLSSILLLTTSLAGETPASFQNRHPLIHPQAEFLGLRSDGQIHAWIYFRDKGVARDQMVRTLSRAENGLSDRVKWRRWKTMDARIVTFRDIPVFEPYTSQVTATGATIRHRSKWLNAISVSATKAQLKQISTLPFVARIDPVLMHRQKIPEILQLQEQRIPSRTKELDAGAGDTLDYGASKAQIEQINVHLAHEAGYEGQGIIVLMLDTGYFKDHESIRTDSILAERDFINQDDNTQNETAHEDSIRQHNHGTLTLSALGGHSPGNLIGPAHRARFLLAKTEIVDREIQQEEDNYVAALEWGEAQGADVASSSLGYLDWYSYCDMDGNTAVTTRAVDIAVSLGMVCVTAAGNQGSESPPQEPCDTLTHYIIAPADADSVIAVGAVNSSGTLASFSSRGPTYDGRIKPEVCARGVLTACASPSGVDSYTYANGTSLSTPLVAGGAAVVLSAHPDWTPMQVREALMNTASRADSADNEYGYGIINVWEAIKYTPSSVEPGSPIPSEFFIAQNYPNPFNVSTTISYDLPRRSDVTLTVFNLLGQKVETVVSQEKHAGRHKITWEGGRFMSGVYLLQMRAGDYVETRKMILLK